MAGRRPRTGLRGLGADDLEVTAPPLVSGSLAAEELEHLALGDDVGGVGHDLHHAHVAHVHHHLEGPRIEEIAHQDAGLVAEDRVGRLASTAKQGIVHHIVVEQGGGVDELRDRRHVHVLVALVAAGPRAQEHQQGAQTLATTCDDVAGNLVDQGHVGVQAALDEPVDRR